MLLYEKEKNKKTVQVHTSARGDAWYVVEVYEHTPNGKICSGGYDVRRDVCNLDVFFM